MKKSMRFQWSSSRQVNFTNWGLHQPDSNPGLEERSVVMNINGGWSTAFSESNYMYVCKTEKIPASKPVQEATDPVCGKVRAYYMSLAVTWRAF
ncbi:C-type mannose receptor 2 [Aplysia californica]|uniref:C-type mannose receptor 2 n=1 Tax=Aplysia californica TaxID=6500 RepID=A0ABM1A2U9_APLCA|nr:C-type mannose receptor 2 [Aplysia californica]